MLRVFEMFGSGLIVGSNYDVTASQTHLLDGWTYPGPAYSYQCHSAGPSRYSRHTGYYKGQYLPMWPLMVTAVPAHPLSTTSTHVLSLFSMDLKRLSERVSSRYSSTPSSLDGENTLYVLATSCILVHEGPRCLLPMYPLAIISTHSKVRHASQR